MKDSKTPSKQGGLSADIQARIGHQLRAIYDEVVRQGVPPRFAELIEQLGSVEAQTATATADEIAAKDSGRV
ncbi:MAG: NepR family anti-sigma factor [Xanthobacteraceae bacterium]|nr:NepR family anti-sigma factor [Xanthobacteraceae bacterium]